MRIILFCDVDHPLHTALMRGFNRWFGLVLGRATAVRNVSGEPLGFVNRIFFLAHHAGEIRKAVKRFSKPLYHALKFTLAAGAVYLLIRW
jgi:beta-hydroxylase